MPEWFPASISTYSNDIDSVFNLIFYITALGFALGEALIIYFLIKYRKREGQRAKFVAGNVRSQLGWILLPAAIVLALDLWIDVAGSKAYNKIKGEMPEGEIFAQVTGKQFNWLITYPGPDNVFGTSDDLEIENDLHVPANKVVKLILKSDDVIHSFFVPVLRLKQDVVPGREINAWFDAKEPGKYEIACAELCGYGHYTMRGFLYVHTEESYQKWLAERWPPGDKT